MTSKHRVAVLFDAQERLTPEAETFLERFVAAFADWVSLVRAGQARTAED